MAAAIRVVLVTVSDTRNASDDESGAVLARKLGDVGFQVKRHAPIRDELLVIRELVRSAATMNEADAIVLTGGTGLAARDVTPEAIEPLFEKRIDGFGEEFRRRSWNATSAVAPSGSSPWRTNVPGDLALGARALLTRATAGVVSGTVIVALPGSPGGAELGAALIIEMLPHAVEVLSGHVRHDHDKAK